jgi:hypothetical protein
MHPLDMSQSHVTSRLWRKVMGFDHRGVYRVIINTVDERLNTRRGRDSCCYRVFLFSFEVNLVLSVRNGLENSWN